jgi:hypothetical protein
MNTTTVTPMSVMTAPPIRATNHRQLSIVIRSLTRRVGQDVVASDVSCSSGRGVKPWTLDPTR